MPNHLFSRDPATACRRAVILLFLAQLAFGFGIVFALPPFEGIDEIGHYARIKSAAFYSPTPAQAGTNDDYAGQYIDRESYDYTHRGPMPLGWIHFPLMPEIDPDSNFMTYGAFFQNQAARNIYASLYRAPPFAAVYEPSQIVNWEYQHPGLYYACLAPVMRLLAGHASLIAAFLWLRGCSWVLAMCGFGIGLWATAHHARKKGWAHADKITALGMLYPFLMPEFFWEFARLGNDSMCLFFFGIAWSMVLWILREPREDGWIYLGLSLALGCMTKALMLPVAAGLFLFLAFYFLRSSPGRQQGLRPWQQPGLKAMLFFILLILPLYARSGNAGSGEFDAVLRNGDSFRLLQQNFSWLGVSKGLQEMGSFLIWRAGTHSLVLLDLPVHILMYAFTVLIGIAYVMKVRRTPVPEAILPLWVILPVTAGLVAHIFVVLILHNATSPGYYLHILAPAWALIFGFGLTSGTEKHGHARVMAAWTAVIVGINFVIAGSYLTYFAGCALPAHVFTPGAAFQSVDMLPRDKIGSCATQPQMIIDHLRLIAWPRPSLIAFSVAALSLIAGFDQLRLIPARSGPTPQSKNDHTR